MELELVDKKEHSETNVVSFRLRPLRPQIKYLAGQFIVIDMYVKGDDKGSTRCLTLSSSPSEQLMMITTTIRESPFKQKLIKTKIGDLISVEPPDGDFVLPNNISSRVVFLSGGIGVTPFRSMLKYASDKNISNEITVFDSNKSPSDVLFKDEFDEIERKNGNIKIVYTFTKESPSGWKSETGRIDADMIRRHLSSLDSEYYVCGPPGMLKSLKEILMTDLKVPESRIHIEEFTGY